MKLSIDLGRWTTTKAVLAVAGALVIGGAVGSAVAISPTVPVPIKWQGGWEAGASGFTGVTQIYTVPAGNNLLVTDVILGNFGNSQNAFGIYVGTGTPGGGICNSNNGYRLHQIPVPVGGTVALSFATGIGFASGTTLCVGGVGFQHVTMRGFLFKPAPTN